MGLEPKGDLFIAQSDGSIAKERPVKKKFKLWPFKKSRLKTLRLINALCYALAALIVLSSIHTSSSDDYDDYQAWITNQTLLSVAPYTQYIWYAIFILQGLFIAASFVPSLWSSELLGYTALTDIPTGLEAFQKSIPVVHYPALCASTALAVYSFFQWNIMSLAFAGSFASTYFLFNIIIYQLDAVTISPNYGNSFRKIKRWMQRRRVADEKNTLNESLNGSRDATNNGVLQYIFLKLPFELYAGYNLGWSVSLLNIIVHKSITSVLFDAVLAYVSLSALLGVGCYMMWKEKKGLCYGVGVGLAWYLFGVFFELVHPSSTVVYTTYSDVDIAAIKYMSVTFAGILVSIVALWAIKHVIKGGKRRLDEEHDEQEEDDDDVGKFVLHGIASVESGGRRIIDEAGDGVDHVSMVIDDALDEAEEGVERVFDAMGV